MKNIFLIFIFVSCVLTPLSASNLYIKVMSVKNQSTLFNLSFDLSEYGYKMHVSKYGKWHRIYTGPFANKSKAESALKIIRKNISREAFITSLHLNSTGTALVKKKEKVASKVKKTPKVKKTSKIKLVKNKDDSISINSYRKSSSPKDATFVINKYIKMTEEERQEKKAQKIREKNDNPVNLYRDTRFFVGVHAGISKFHIEQKDTNGIIALENTPKDGGIPYGLELGYYFNKNIFTTLNYQHTNLENCYFDNLFASLNYQFTNTKLSAAYIGAIGGYNRMSWTNFPVTTLLKEEDSSSFFAGLQIGNDIPLSESLSAYIFYRYMLLDNVTNITVGTVDKKINHSSEQNINVGLKYNF